jgi:small subunit ribosomal protein S20
MRSEIKRFRKLVQDGQFDEAKGRLGKVYSAIDRTAGKGTIHANTAARYKSRLAQLLRRETTAAG